MEEIEKEASCHCVHLVGRQSKIARLKANGQQWDEHNTINCWSWRRRYRSSWAFIWSQGNDQAHDEDDYLSPGPAGLDCKKGKKVMKDRSLTESWSWPSIKERKESNDWSISNKEDLDRPLLSLSLMIGRSAVGLTNANKKEMHS